MAFSYLPILMYHQILPESDPHFKKHIAVDPIVFEKQIAFLIKSGWSFMTLKEYFSKPRPKKVVILSFDDVTSTYIQYAKPILDKFRIKGCVFPIQNMTTQTGAYFNLSPDGITPLTEAQIKGLADEGHEVGSHCQTHRNLHQIPFTEAVKEMKESKEWLENILQDQIQTICFPIGGIDADLVKEAKKIGYQIGLSTFKGTIQLHSDQMALRRVNIKNDVLDEKLKKAVSPFYGFRRLLTRPIRSKYKVTNRHPDAL